MSFKSLLKALTEDIFLIKKGKIVPYNNLGAAI